MPKLSPNSITLLDGNIILSQRHESAKWQARFKVDSRWIRITTKQKDIKEAKTAAEELYLDARYRVKHELPAQTKRFKDVAKLAIDRMQKAVAGGQGKKVYRDYIQAINNYLIPHFGAHHIDRVNYAMIQPLWNVLIGGMSIVGPCAYTTTSALLTERSLGVPKFKEFKPGLTGWAQVRMFPKYKSAYAKRQQADDDLFYVANWSPCFDARIILMILLSKKWYALLS